MHLSTLFVFSVLLVVTPTFSVPIPEPKGGVGSVLSSVTKHVTAARFDRGVSAANAVAGLVGAWRGQPTYQNYRRDLDDTEMFERDLGDVDEIYERGVDVDSLSERGIQELNFLD